MPQDRPDTTIVHRFYAAFARRDGAAMAACYHPSVHFTDPVFDLQGAEAGAMWQMLCERGADLRVEARDIVVNAGQASAHWDAWYTFSVTGRKVHNVIDATMTLRDGLILRHVDQFDFWRWARQALGAPGLLLGWSSTLRRKVQANARRGLDQYIAKRGPPPVQ